MKIDRLVGIVLYLLNHQKATAPELAERFEVSRRTICRDVETICQAGIPLITEQGYRGGISIAQGYTISHALLTKEDLESIIIGLQSIDSVSRHSHAERLSDRLQVDGERFSFVRDRMLIDLASHYKEEFIEKIEIVRAAIEHCECLAFHYYYEQGECDRVIEPYFLSYKWSAWYVYGYCLERRDFRSFKLRRMDNLHGAGQHFEPRAVSAEDASMRRYFEAGEVRFTALFSQRVKYRLIDEYGVHGFTERDDQRLLLTNRYTSRTQLIEWLLSFGDQVQVLAPEDLRAEIARRLSNAASQYEESDS